MKSYSNRRIIANMASLIFVLFILPIFFMPIDVRADSEEKYTISIISDGNGKGTASVSSGTRGTVVTLKATANEGFKFKEWILLSGEVMIDDVWNATTTFVIRNTDVKIVAIFEELEIPETPVNPSDNLEEMSDPAIPDTEEQEETSDEEPETPPERSETEQIDSVNPEEIEEPEPVDVIETNPTPTPEQIPDSDWLDYYREMIHSAGDTDTIEFSGTFALPYEFMHYLKEHPTITLNYHVTYDNTEYDIIIKGSEAIVDVKIPWYGPLWLAANYGNKTLLGVKGTYIVKLGDTLSEIAVKLGVTVQYLVDKNGIEDVDFIKENQMLYY